MSQEEIIIPKGWELIKLGEYSNIIRGSSPRPAGDPLYFGGDIPWIKISDITASKGKYLFSTKNGLTSQGVLKSRFLKAGSLILTTSMLIAMPKILKIDGCIHDGFLAVLNIDKKIYHEFLYYYFLNYRGIIEKENVEGTAIKNINTEVVKNLNVPLPPITIQKQIVAKLDHILGELEVKKKEILKLKEKKESAISKLSQKTIGEIILNHMKIDNIPKKWQIKTVEDCVDIQAGFAQGEKNVANGTIHLRMNNIGRNFQLNYDLTRTINATKEQLIKYKLEKDDVIFNNTNSPELVGKSFIFNDDKVCLYSNHLTRCRVNKELLLPEWLLFYIRGKWLRRDFERMCNKWINQAAFGGNKLKELKIPIPPLDEQKQILKILKNISIQFEHISNLTKAIKNRDEQNKKFIDNIQSSILDSAFSGKLLN